MKQLTVLDEAGQELRHADLDDDGCKLPPGMNDQACLVGALRLLEDIARRDDNRHYREAARKQADALKAMIKRIAKNRGVDLTNTEVFGKAPRALPPANDVLTIDMK